MTATFRYDYVSFESGLSREIDEVKSGAHFTGDAWIQKAIKDSVIRAIRAKN